MGGYGTVPESSNSGFVQPQYAPNHSVPFIQPLPTETWAAGVCDCFQDMGLCCDVLCCSCCQAGRIWSAATESRPDHMSVPVCCGLLVAEYFIGGLANCLLTMYLRDNVRHKYGIMGDGCDDCCMSFWCTPCVMCQLHRELSKRGVTPGHVCCEPSVRKTQPIPVGVQSGYVDAPVCAPPQPVQYK
eukprot:TRINITY_DN14421_c0_g2_i2.p1 TRINITY_DN14421_c0_g2~~TRINITY_DN14421_c0_g2_i2.p1  ORF type:complete len:209 (+),score=23.42 TRINITY_DN14421_c0_g2_i2:72-629(+)